MADPSDEMPGIDADKPSFVGQAAICFAAEIGDLLHRRGAGADIVLIIRDANGELAVGSSIENAAGPELPARARTLVEDAFKYMHDTRPLIARLPYGS
jgi:hypothetical protein